MADAKIISYGKDIGAGTTVIPDNQVALDIESTDAKEYVQIDTTDSAEKLLLAGGGAKVGVNKAAPLAQLHVRTADSGQSSAHAYADEFIIEGSVSSGMTIQSGNANTGSVVFADSGSNYQAAVRYEHGANRMDLYNNAATRLSIASDGVVSIASTEDPITIGGSTGAKITFARAGGVAINCSHASGELYFQMAGSNKIKFDTNGRVGIGQTGTVAAPLHVVGVGGDTGKSWSTGADQPTMILENSDGASKDRCLLALNGDGNSGSSVDLYHQDTRISGFSGYPGNASVFGQAVKLTLEATGANAVALKTNAKDRLTVGGTGTVETTGGCDTSLSGTFTATNGSAAISSGSSTAFLTQLSVGSAIQIFESGGTSRGIYTVTAIADNNNLTLDSTVSGLSSSPLGSMTGKTDSDLFQIKTGDGKVSFHLPSGADATTLIGTGTGVSKDIVGVTSVGSLAGHGTGGVQCSFFGYKAGLLGGGNYSTIIGSEAMKASTDAGGGSHAQQNVALGYNAGATLTTAKDCVIIGSGANGIAGGDNQVAIGRSATCTAGDQVRLGNTDISDIDGEVALTATSDQRVKTNVEDLAIGLEFINALRPVSFTRIHPSEWPEEIREQRYMEGQVVTGSDGTPEIISTSTFDVETQQPIKGDFDDTKRSDGLLAQEVQAACENLGATFNGIKERPDGKLGIQYSLLVAPLIKAVQELTARIEELENGE